ncbi:LysR family transcriptional regulator [Pendulispora albinea]|uniref:LysR family transcriptional regulator n=1 Tax=Pendulispora albinea TaxID=2741071 RepID=A0ABZ2M4S5_9BACT
MNEDYGRNLNLNLLRVFVVVADCGSVTAAASQLYLTQPAISAALRRLTESVGAPLFMRQGRGLVLTHRGASLLATVRPHLSALVEAALDPAPFDPRTSEHILRLGFADAMEASLLPGLLRALEREAPRMRVISVPIQFRTVAAALMSRQIDAAITVADEMPPGIERRPLSKGSFVCLYDPRHVRLKKPLRERDYFARDHVIVSYNADLRGIVEDMLHKKRKVRCSVASFANVGAIVDGSSLLATVPHDVAHQICATRPHLRTMALPFDLGGAPLELLWHGADDDAAGRFIREKIIALAERGKHYSDENVRSRATRRSDRPPPHRRHRSDRASS